MKTGVGSIKLSLPLFVLLVSTQLWAAFETGRNTSPVFSKIELDGKKSYDERNKGDRVSLESDAKIYYRIGPTWGPFAGLNFSQETPPRGPQTQTWNEASLGVFFFSDLLNVPWKTFWMFNHVPEENLRQDLSRRGSLEAEVRSKFPLTQYSFLRFKLNFEEYLLTKNEKGVAHQKIKTELTPIYDFVHFSVGWRNRVFQNYVVAEGEKDRFESGPMLKYNYGPLESTFYVLYEPLGGKNQSFKEQADWQKNAAYLLELELNY